MRRFFLIFSLCLAALAARPAFVAALPNFPPIVYKTYQPKTGGTVVTAKCTLCHVQNHVPKLNPYGLDVKAALQAAGTKILTPEILHSIEDKDSDGDGATNAQEVAADTLPGDAASKPAVIPVAKRVESKSNSSASGDEPGPWAIQTLLFPKHAQHPVVVHFPIALLFVGLFFDFLGARTKNRSLLSAGYYNIAAAALFAPITVLTGLGAWWFQFQHPPLQGNILYHLVLGLTSLAIIWLLWGLRRNEMRGETTTFRIAYVALGVLALPIIAITGHLGGILVAGG